MPCRHLLFDLGGCALRVGFTRYVDQELRDCVESINWCAGLRFSQWVQTRRNFDPSRVYRAQFVSDCAWSLMDVVLKCLCGVGCVGVHAHPGFDLEECELAFQSSLMGTLKLDALDATQRALTMEAGLRIDLGSSAREKSAAHVEQHL